MTTINIYNNYMIPFFSKKNDIFYLSKNKDVLKNRKSILFLALLLVSLETHPASLLFQNKLESTTNLNLQLPDNNKIHKPKDRVTGASFEKSDTENSNSHFGIFHNFWPNTRNSFTGNNLWYHGAAFGSTFFLATRGIDRNVQDYFQEDPVGEPYGISALILGGIWQPVIGGTLYFSSDAETKTAGSAVLQTAIVQFAYTSLLKAATGRPDPIEDGDPTNKQSGVCGNSSDATTFFQLVKGCTWPSGHASSAFSLVSSLYAFYPEKKWIAYWGYPVAVAISLGMIENDEHWFSDIVAGAFIGHIIGWTIGKNFRSDFDQSNNYQASQKHFINPIVSSAGVGLTYQVLF